MSNALRVCEGCARHVRASEAECPFCARPRPLTEKLATAAAVVAAGVALSACYGGPPRHENLERLALTDATPSASASAPASAGASASATPSAPASAAPSSSASAAGTPCERSYAAVAQLLSTASQPAGAPKRKIPAKDAYLKACNALPPEMQQCVDITYAASHGAECDAASKKVDPAKMKSIRDMMNGI